MSIGNRFVVCAALVALIATGCSPVGASSGDGSGGPVRALGQVGDGSTARGAPLDADEAFAETSSSTTVPIAATTTAAQTTVTEVSTPRGTIVAHASIAEVTAYTEPEEASEVIEAFANPTTRNGPLVFQAIGTEQGEWIEVLLPIRPNGSTGWVKTADVDLTLNPYLIEIDTSAYELRVFRHGELELSAPIALGTGDTPTPIGQFYLVELLKPSNPNGAYGSFAYGLSGYSDTLESFNGGEGVIGIHGTNRPELLGQDVSHGCIRVANPDIEQMVTFLPLGTPVHISA